MRTFEIRLKLNPETLKMNVTGGRKTWTGYNGSKGSIGCSWWGDSTKPTVVVVFYPKTKVESGLGLLPVPKNDAWKF